MISFNRIICGIDFSDASRHALDHAIAVARWYESELTVLHVLTERPPVEMIPSLASRLPRAPVEPSVERQRAVLQAARQFVVESGTDSVDVEVLVQDAPEVFTEILVQSDLRKADLIVLGTHGHSGFGRFLLGSVAEQVLRKATAPTLIVPPRTDRVPPSQRPPFKRMLCPIDFSTSSIDGLAYAMSFAEDADASLTLLHVIDVSPELRDDEELGNLTFGAMMARAEAACTRRLHALVPTEIRDWCEVDVVVKHGRPSTEIDRLARDRESDLIVMGVHGRGTVDRVLFGSKTHEMLRLATCPVLTVRSGR